ncbi:hypothetical protein PseudUWO311_03395 [Pseudanabaena sp. UWO311]|uniref:hypothetical protein n=1 Tax=Pseudanabaena sp. UWO311 TaxID=2487337 RepID=UPI0011581846|nr:hypothetical protein [Pseudanabaena sp. UWO311]TYQ29187.1 hypothetical protein PseudUWO311_03395 [Pseudanabaena sp. UWO311]
MIKGIYGDEYQQFQPEQWVNVYRRDSCDRAIYYATMQIDDLKWRDEPLEDFLLEPVTEMGDVMSVEEAKQCSR